MNYYIFLLLFALSTSLKSQDTCISKIYMRAAFSFSIGTNQSQYLFDPLNSVEFNQTSFTNPVLGNATSFIGGFGYRCTKNIAIETNLAYVNGLETNLYSYQSNTIVVKARMNTTKQILFQPTVVLSTKFEKFHPYIKVGLVVPISNQSEFYYTIQSKTNSELFNQYKYLIDNQLSVGLNGCVGISYAISDNFEVFAEAEETNTRSFHTKAVGIESVAIANWPPTYVMNSNYQFLDSKDINSTNESEILNFPISFGRQSYNFGIKFNF